MSEFEKASGEVGRRRARDWAVDVCCISVAAVFSLVTSDSVANDPGMSDGALFADLATGAAGCLALWVRRRWPVELAVALCLVATVSYYVTGPLIVALFTVAVHRPFRTVAFVGGLAIASGFVSSAVHPDPGLDYFASVLIGATLINGVIAWGMYVRSRRQLLVSLHERARRAESEAALRAERAQRLTRERIAREMHDVLAHRLSLLSVHAGALEYRTDVSPEELAKAARTALRADSGRGPEAAPRRRRRRLPAGPEPARHGRRDAHRRHAEQLPQRLVVLDP